MAQRFIITGRVQGVGYRSWTRREASALGLAGWVRNLPDGSVEVLANGPETSLRQLEQHLHKGPFFSRVDNVNILPADGYTIPDGFVISLETCPSRTA